MSSKCIDFLYVIKSTIVNDCFVICVGLSLLSKTVDMTVFFSELYKMKVSFIAALNLFLTHKIYNKS